MSLTEQHNPWREVAYLVCAGRGRHRLGESSMKTLKRLFKTIGLKIRQWACLTRINSLEMTLAGENEALHYTEDAVIRVKVMAAKGVTVAELAYEYAVLMDLRDEWLAL